MYADINGLQVFYEIRGTPDPLTVPVVLLHGAISATGTSFGPLPDLLAQTRQVIAVEQQGHGWTADIDRPLSVQAMADDTLALLASPGIGQADLFGYSLGAGIALNIITNHPAVVRQAVLASVTYDKTGLHPDMFGAPVDERADFIWDSRASRGVQVGPFPRDQAPVPGEQSARGHNPVKPQARGQQPGQGGDHGAVGAVRPGGQPGGARRRPHAGAPGSRCPWRGRVGRGARASRTA
jgi:pimeloyl-ACP methyl ester carboxylesterase